MNSKLDQLTRRVQSLEQNLVTDMKLILNILQGTGQQVNVGSSSGVSVVKETKPDVSYFGF